MNMKLYIYELVMLAGVIGCGVCNAAPGMSLFSDRRHANAGPTCADPFPLICTTVRRGSIAKEICSVGLHPVDSLKALHLTSNRLYTFRTLSWQRRNFGKHV